MQESCFSLTISPALQFQLVTFRRFSITIGSKKTSRPKKNKQHWGNPTKHRRTKANPRETHPVQMPRVVSTVRSPGEIWLKERIAKFDAGNRPKRKEAEMERGRGQCFRILFLWVFIFYVLNPCERCHEFFRKNPCF